MEKTKKNNEQKKNRNEFLQTFFLFVKIYIYILMYNFFLWFVCDCMYERPMRMSNV